MPESIYILDEHPVYDEAIRALQDSDPARASTIFNPLISKLLNNTHHVKQQVEAVAESVGGDGGAANIKLTDGTSVEVAIGDLKEHKAALDPLTGKILVEQLPAMDYDIQGSAALVQGNLDSHTGNTTIHVTQAEKTVWDTKETPTGAQAKADAVQANLTAHAGDQSNPHSVTAAQTGAADISLSNVTNANFKAKAESAGAAGQKIYDQVIRTQAEFEELIASPTWLDAVSVCFIGDGGTLKFTRSDGQGCKIPQTVKQIQGMNSATIDIKEFYNSTTNKAALWYETAPTTTDYWVNGMTVICSSKAYPSVNCCPFFRCTQLSNCTGTTNKVYEDGYFYAFNECTKLLNCTGICVGDSFTDVYAFSGCTRLINCSGNVKGGDKAYGFFGCKDLANCDGSGSTKTAGLGGGGYGFYDCSYLNGCKQGATASTKGFLGGTNTRVDTNTVAALKDGGGATSP